MVDQRLDVRGVYNGTVPFDMDRLIGELLAPRTSGN